MRKFPVMLVLLGLLYAAGLGAAEPETGPAPGPVAPAEAAPAATVRPAGPVSVVVIPIRQEIAKPVLYVLRRGLKEAIENKADVVLLDMKTPGGALDVTFDIMEALGRFPGRTITFVNNEAISAGAFISAVTDDIWFASDGVIGAAAPVLSTGGEIDASMKQKIVSYLRARVRAVSEGKGYRGEVISAMIDADFELKIGEEVLKPKGELLSLTATEAAKTYGDPARPLLAAGIADDIADLLSKEYGADGYSLTTLEVTWSESLAQYLNRFAPLFLGLGLFALYIEFKTPGFGVFGVSGILLLMVVFFGHYVAGLSGHEPALVFIVGVTLVLVELLFFPGVIFVAASGVLLMLGSLIWSMADLWPNEPIEFSGDVFLAPLTNLGLGLIVSFALMVALARFLPRGWVWDRLVLAAAIDGSSQAAPTAPGHAGEGGLVGRQGVAATALRPGGQIEIDGQRYEARVALGYAEAGDIVVVRRQSGFELIVEKAGP
jgi:membrane-bound serine protease (ClpP class)